jgi:gamma-glutamylcyclotransferase (GGCT)/AIG2-like uncharacterized protein YtfP
MTTRPDVLYFAYGSNMLRARLGARTPSAVSLGRGRLQGHALAWHKPGADGSGKCDIVPQAGAHVWGVLYRMTAEDKQRLDEIEDVGRGYEDELVPIVLDDGIVETHAYRATTADPTLSPFDWYHAIVVAGAREHGLPRDYVAGIEAVWARPDPDADRRARNLALARTRREPRQAPSDDVAGRDENAPAS